MTTVLDFAMLPPEINSARMYSGAGSSPMLAAASAWKGLSAELRSTALSYGRVLSALTDEEWHGPASAAMASAAMPYVAWMNTTAAQAEQTATQAEAAAAAYDTAFAATVPPPEIAANRAQLPKLVATNTLGHNTPAIAANEAQYAQMWAQDASAMYGYAGNSAAATRLASFTGPQQIANPSATTAQSAAVTQAATTSAGTGQSTLSKLTSAVPNALQTMASPSSSSSTTGLSSLLSGWNPFAPGSANDTTGLNGVLNALFGENTAFGQLLNANIWNTIFSSGFYMPGNFLGTAVDFMGLGGGAGAGAEGAAGAAEGAAGAAGAAEGAAEPRPARWAAWGLRARPSRETWVKRLSSDRCRSRRAGPGPRRRTHWVRHWEPRRWSLLRRRWPQVCPGCRWAASARRAWAATHPNTASGPRSCRAHPPRDSPPGGTHFTRCFATNLSASADPTPGAAWRKRGGGQR